MKWGIQIEKLQHNGVLVPPKYEAKNLSISVNGKKIELTQEQEEMAYAYAKKIGSVYAEDPVFVKNFHNDLSKKIGIRIKLDEVDYSEILDFIEKDHSLKLNLTRETRKQQTALKKALREINKERYGYAWVDGNRMEVANYIVEPNSIFIGRGKHPLRGRWKEGPCEKDIELNLSPDATRPLGNWKAVVWQPNAMWITRWQDKLTGKMKYVWLSESSILKQRKDIQKFNKANELHQNLLRIQEHIWKNLSSDNLRRRKTATVCFLINKLKIRVGDEKDPDEADTVGASTLRPEHINFNEDGTITFNFLGKDSVPHTFNVKLLESVVRNLKEFAQNKGSTLFEGVTSKHVSEFLDEVVNGLSAKVFRTYYASEAVKTKLEEAYLKIEDPIYVKKYVATMANLEAAKVCNHKRTIPKTWLSSMEKKKLRLKMLKNRANTIIVNLRNKINTEEEKYCEKLKKLEEYVKTEEELESYQRLLIERKQQNKPVQALKRRIELKRNTLMRKKHDIKELKLKHSDRVKKLKQRLDDQRRRYETIIDEFGLRIKAQKETSDFNLSTSLKSYIDPGIYYKWGKLVNYDWKQYYPKALQKKFNWIETRVYNLSQEE